MITKRRKYRPGDYNKIMGFLREMYKDNKTPNCWLPQKWEYTEHFISKLHTERGYTNDWYDFISIWENGNQIVGICHNEVDRNVFMEIRSGYESLYSEMLDWAENVICRFKIPDLSNYSVKINSLESHHYRNKELLKRGYVRDEEATYQNYQTTIKNYYYPTLPTNYSFVDKREVPDARNRHYAVHKSFHPDDIYPEVCPTSFIDMEKAPLFRDDLEIMIKHLDKYVAFCVIWYDPDTNTALFEPVGVHPEYQGMGLGKQMLIEGLRRLKDLGVINVYVEAFNENRKTFYNKVGFNTYDANWGWKKV